MRFVHFSMPKLFIRIVAFLLVPCLMADPTLATVLSHHPSQALSSTVTTVNSENFQVEAFQPIALWMLRAIENVRTAPHVRVLAVVAAAGAVAIGVGVAHPHVSPEVWHRSLWILTAAAFGWMGRKFGFMPGGLMVSVPEANEPGKVEKLKPSELSGHNTKVIFWDWGGTLGYWPTGMAVGASEFLELTQRLGIKNVLVTSAPREEVDHWIQTYNTGAYFADIICPIDKTNPIDKAKEIRAYLDRHQEELAASDAIGMGDDPVKDLAAFKEAGIRSVGVLIPKSKFTREQLLATDAVALIHNDFATPEPILELLGVKQQASSPANFHGRPIRLISDLADALRERSQLRVVSLPDERHVTVESVPQVRLEGQRYGDPWGLTPDHWTLLFELASHTPPADDLTANALQRVAQRILNIHEYESQDRHISDWRRTGLGEGGVESYVLGDMRDDARHKATVPLNSVIRPSVFSLIEDRTPDRLGTITQALHGQSVLLQRGPYAHLRAEVRVWTTNDNTAGFVSSRGRRPIPQRVSIDYTFGPHGPILNIRVAGGFAASASDNELAQVILNPMLKLITGLNDAQTYLAESLYNAESNRSSIVSDLARHDLQDAFNQGRSYVLHEVIRQSVGASGVRHYDNALFSIMAQARADVITGLTMENDALNPLYDEAAVIAGDLLVALIAQRARQPMVERLRLAFGDRMYPHDPASLSQMVLVDASQFRSGLLQKLQGQEEDRVQAGIGFAEEANLVGFHGERVATYMDGIDVMPFRSQFLVRYTISVKGNSEETSRQFMEDKANFVNEGTALAERVVSVNPSVVTVSFEQKRTGEWVLKISGPEVRYRSVLRGAAPRPEDAIERDPDLLGTFEISESDFRDGARREAFFERMIQPPAVVHSPARAEIRMDYRRLMTRDEIDQRINQIPRAARPGIGFLDPIKDGELRFEISNSRASFTNTTAFSAHGGFLYVADLSSQRGMQPVIYKVLPREAQWYEEIALASLPDEIKKDFGIPSTPSLHMTWWEHRVRQFLGLFMANPPEWLVNAIVSGTEPLMLMGAQTLSGTTGFDALLTPAFAVGFGAFHRGRSNMFKAFATGWGLGVMALARYGYVDSLHSYLMVAAAQFVINLILRYGPRVLHSNAPTELVLAVLKAA